MMKNSDIYNIQDLKLTQYANPCVYVLKNKKKERITVFRVDKLDDKVTVNIFNQFKQWLDEECDPLDYIERRYLKSVIRPFIHRVEYVVKTPFDNNKSERIVIMMKDNDGCFYFPSIKKGTMYKGMDPGRKYTLHELKIY